MNRLYGKTRYSQTWYFGTKILLICLPNAPVDIFFSIWCKFILPLSPAIHRIANAPIILRSRWKEDQSHPNCIFYWKLSKVTLDYILKIINLNYTFIAHFKVSVKALSHHNGNLISVSWWHTFKNSTHTFASVSEVSSLLP